MSTVCKLCVAHNQVALSDLAFFIDDSEADAPVACSFCDPDHNFFEGGGYSAADWLVYHAELEHGAEGPCEVLCRQASFAARMTSTLPPLRKSDLVPETWA